MHACPSSRSASRRPAFLQGLVARSSAKVFVDVDAITFFVSSVVGDFVANRIRNGCAELEVAWKPAIDYVARASREGSA